MLPQGDDSEKKAMPERTRCRENDLGNFFSDQFFDSIVVLLSSNHRLDGLYHKFLINVHPVDEVILHPFLTSVDL
jgi:hypothetical protein